MRYRYVIVDVFSREPFGGNQLAVLTDARGISDEGLQAIAREFNFPESTFVLPAADPLCVRRVRIFTPARELPFAGHPTVGTACVLAMEGLVELGAFTIEEGIGPIRVEVAQRGSGFAATFTVDQAPTLLPEAVGASDAAAVLGVEGSAVQRVFAATLGIPFTFIQLRDRTTVDGARLDHAVWKEVFDGASASQLYVFAGSLADGGEIYSRMFAPALGVPEDPATGSAAGILAGAAATITGASGGFSLTIEQGVALGRPSVLAATARLEGGEVVAIEVGGAAAFVAEGEINIPDRYLTH